MGLGRIVRIYDSDSGALIRACQVGIENPRDAVQAVINIHPEFASHRVEAASSIEGTTMAYAEIRPGEVRYLDEAPHGGW